MLALTDKVIFLEKVITGNILSFLKSDTAHDLAVKGLAGGMKFKSDTTCKYETIKEDAKDLLEEAKVKNEG